MKSSHLLAVPLLVSVVHAQSPTPYCTAGTSTNGCTPSINANVQPNTANTAGCVITVTGVEGQKQGLVFYGVDNSTFTPAPFAPGSSSLRCVKPPTMRMGAALNSGGTAGQCDGAYAVDWDAFQAANPSALGNPWAAGDRVFAQAWYRDPLAPTASNLSNAIELTLRNMAPTPCVTTIPGMALIPAGAFTMGSNAANTWPYYNEPFSGPAHQVTISYCFWMGETEVTQAQFSGLMGWNPSFFAGANNPVERVRWSGARNYCAALNARESALGNVPPGYEYRLPTEAEWEYACRAGTTTEFNTGAALACNESNFEYSHHTSLDCSSNGTTPVASHAPNAFGLYDMHGNVWEWCLDGSSSPYTAAPVTDPYVPGGFFRIVRGGAWTTDSNFCRSAHRFYLDPILSNGDLGFRVVLAPIIVP